MKIFTSCGHEDSFCLKVELLHESEQRNRKCWAASNILRSVSDVVQVELRREDGYVGHIFQDSFHLNLKHL